MRCRGVDHKSQALVQSPGVVSPPDDVSIIGSFLVLMKDAAIRTELALGYCIVKPRGSSFLAHGLGKVDAVELQTGIGIK